MGSAVQYKVRSSRITAVIFFIFYSSGRICLIPFLTLFFRDLGFSPFEAGIIRGCQTLVTFLAIPLLISCAKACHRWHCVLILPLIISTIMYMCLILTPLFNGVFNFKDTCEMYLKANDSDSEMDLTQVSPGIVILQNKSTESSVSVLSKLLEAKNSFNEMPNSSTAFAKTPSNSSSDKLTLVNSTSSLVNPNVSLTITSRTSNLDSQILNRINESAQYVVISTSHNSTEPYNSFFRSELNKSENASYVPQTNIPEKISSENNTVQSTNQNQLPNEKYVINYNNSLTTPFSQQSLDHSSDSDEYVYQNNYLAQPYDDNLVLSKSEELFKTTRSQNSIESALDTQRFFRSAKLYSLQNWMVPPAIRQKTKTLPPAIVINGTENTNVTFQFEHNATLKNSSIFPTLPSNLERNKMVSTQKTFNNSGQIYPLKNINNKSFSTYFWIACIIGVIGEAFGASVEVTADEAWFRFLDEIDYTEKYQQHFVAASVGSTFAAFGVSAIASNSVCHLNRGLSRFAIHCYAFSVIMIFVSILSHYFPVPHQRALISEKWSRISVLKVIFSDIRTVLMTFAVIISGACYAGLHDFFLWHMEDIGTKEYILGIAVSLAVVSEIPVHLGYRWVLKRTTLYGCVSLSLICYSLRFLHYAFVRSPWALIPMQLLHSLSTTLMWRIIHVYVDQISSPGTDRKVHFMFKVIYWSLGYVAGTVLSGFLYTWSGPKSYFLTMAIIAFVFSVLFLIAQYYLPRLQRRTYSKILFEGITDGEERIYHSICTESDDENDDNDDWLEKAIRITAQEKRHKT